MAFPQQHINIQIPETATSNTMSHGNQFFKRTSWNVARKILHVSRLSVLRGGEGGATITDDLTYKDAIQGAMSDILRPPAPDEDDLAAFDEAFLDDIDPAGDVTGKQGVASAGEDPKSGSESDELLGGGRSSEASEDDDSSDPFRPAARSLGGPKGADSEDPRSGGRRLSSTDRCGALRRSVVSISTPCVRISTPRRHGAVPFSACLPRCIKPRACARARLCRRPDYPPSRFRPGPALNPALPARTRIPNARAPVHAHRPTATDGVAHSPQARNARARARTHTRTNTRARARDHHARPPAIAPRRRAAWEAGRRTALRASR